MAFRCMQCNGNMIYDIDSQQMKCQHCGAMMDPEQFRLRDVSKASVGSDKKTCPQCLAPLDEEGAEVCPYCGAHFTNEAEEKMVQFSCQNCGASLASTEESIIGVCPYCGGQSLLKEETSGDAGVEFLIPFQITKERCESSYRSHTKKILYLPKELKDPKYIQNFTGIYMPFYEYDAAVTGSTVTGTKTVEHRSNYDVINTYSIPAQIRGQYSRGTPFDASRYLDDEISARLMPFSTELQRPFHPAYLSGFYADAATVPPERYYPDAQQQSGKDILTKIEEQTKQRDGISISKTSKVETNVTGHHSVLFPMWFLTWRSKKRVAYAVVNGESGKLAADLPLDIKTFALGCGIAALAIFLLLELLFQPTPLATSIISLLAGIAMAIGILTSTKKVYNFQTHALDKGWSGSEDNPAQMQQAAAAQKRKSLFQPDKPDKKKILGFLQMIPFILIAVVIRSVSGRQLAGLLRFLIPVAALGMAGFTAWKVFVYQKSIPERQPILSAIILLITVILNAAVMLLSPVNDLWYYLGDAACILGLILSSLLMIQIYNVGTTRPLPKLFDRKEV